MLLYLSPAASFVLGALLYFMEAQVSHYLEGRVVSEARKTLEQQLDSTRTSDKHKMRIRKLLEDLEATVALREVERVRYLGVMSPTPQVESVPTLKETGEAG